MVLKILLIGIVGVLVTSCTSFEFNNPNDPANGAVYLSSSSSSEGQSSSSSSEGQSSSSYNGGEEIVSCKVYFLGSLLECEEIKTSDCEDYNNTPDYEAEIVDEC
ncbi:MAG: hypothetical protein FWH22_07945 [Fibromonadales bacterium]|nr:hypothetical protein [Fibromonadales bacterium]